MVIGVWVGSVMWFKEQWRKPNGYRDVLNIGLPLVVSMGSNTVMQFTDRVFLGNYSLEAIAAAMPAGVSSFLFLCFFMGTATYTSVFIAQYTGAGRLDRVGAALWQGIYFCLMAALVLASLNFLAEPLFRFSGHPPEVQKMEVVYFRILILGGGMGVLSPTLGSFYSGRGLTRPVMIINVIGAAFNIPLDYALINGLWIFPEMGIQGAAIATVASATLVVLLFLILIFSPGNNRAFKLWQGRRFDPELFKRLIRYGLPNGIQFFINTFAITFFIFMVGRLGKSALAAANIVFSIDTLAFLPVVGLSIGLSIMVGQAIGRQKPEDAAAAARSTIHISISQMGLMALLFVLIPEVFMNLFKPHSLTVAQFAPIMESGVVLLRFVAVYTVLDALGITYSGAIKGAGDTRFVMWAMASCSVTFVIIPLFVGIEIFNAGVVYSFTCLTVYVCVLALVFSLRFRQGKWQAMSVIEGRGKTGPPLASDEQP